MRMPPLRRSQISIPNAPPGPPNGACVKMRRDLRVGVPGPGPERGRTPRLKGGPHARGLVVRVCIMNPKKPNSAMRHVAKMRLYGKPRVTARIPGRGYGVSKFSRCLVRGGRANDLPGVGYSLVRGALDFAPCFGKIRRRSFYGVARSPERVTFVRRKLRRRGVSRLQMGSYPVQLGANPRPCNACGRTRARTSRAPATGLEALKLGGVHEAP